MNKKEPAGTDTKAKTDRLERENRMRTLIKNEAFKLMAQNGIDQVSMREIAEKVKVTKPVLYYYFKDKEDLCASIIEERRGEFDTVLAEACSKGLCLEEIIALAFNAHLNFFEKDALNSKFMIRMISYVLDERNTRLRQPSSHEDNWNKLLQQAEERGEIPRDGRGDAGRLVRAVFGQIMLSAYVHMNLGKGKKQCADFFYDKETTKRLAHIILLGINQYYKEKRK